jgi:hypothetical protein
MTTHGYLRRMELNRLEHILTVLTQQRQLSPAHLPADIEQRSRALAATLAREGVLVLAGDVPPHLPDHEQWLVQWVQIQVQFYKLLAETFFPSFAGYKPPVYADRMLPAVVVFDTENAVVAAALAKILIPYVALRHGQSPILDVEIRGMMQMVLQDIDPAKLRDHESLTSNGIALLRQWLAMPIQQIPLIEPEQPLYEELQAPLAAPPAAGATAPTPIKPDKVPPAAPPPPNTLPELDKLTSQPAKTETQEMFASKVPIFYGKKSGGFAPFPPPPKKKTGGE